MKRTDKERREILLSLNNRELCLVMGGARGPDYPGLGHLKCLLTGVLRWYIVPGGLGGVRWDGLTWTMTAKSLAAEIHKEYSQHWIYHVREAFQSLERSCNDLPWQVYAAADVAEQLYQAAGIQRSIVGARYLNLAMEKIEAWKSIAERDGADGTWG
jgi:hypothetical protein